MRIYSNTAVRSSNLARWNSTWNWLLYY